MLRICIAAFIVATVCCTAADTLRTTPIPEVRTTPVVEVRTTPIPDTIVKGLPYVHTVPLNGFWGIEFGSSRKECKEEMRKKKKGARFIRKWSDSTTLVYTGAVFAGRRTDRMELCFYKNRLYATRVYIYSKNGKRANQLHKEIKKEIDDRYYATDSIAKSNLNRAIALRLASREKNALDVVWEFKRGDSKDITNALRLCVQKSRIVKIIYADLAIGQEEFNTRAAEYDVQYKKRIEDY